MRRCAARSRGRRFPAGNIGSPITGKGASSTSYCRSARRPTPASGSRWSCRGSRRNAGWSVDSGACRRLSDRGTVTSVRCRNRGSSALAFQAAGLRTSRRRAGRASRAGPGAQRGGRRKRRFRCRDPHIAVDGRRSSPRLPKYDDQGATLSSIRARTALDRYPTKPVTEQGCASGELRRRRRRYSARLAPGRPWAPEPKRPVRRASVENRKREPGGSMETKSPTLTVPGQPSGESHVRPQSRSPASAKRVSFSRRPHDQRGRVPPAGRAETQRRRRWRRSWPRATLSAAGFP